MIIGKAISPFGIKRRNGGGGGNDADAQAFITASGISGTNATAINTLVVNLKSANIWTKMKAVYPMVGSTATSCKWNLKNPVDSNAAYRLVFSGGGTFSANGYLPNGTNAYANTFFTPATNGLLNSAHISFYSRTNVAAAAVVIGSNNAGPNYYYTTLSPRNLSGQCVNAINENTGEVFTTANSLGLFTTNRQSATDYDVWKNSTKEINTTKSSLGQSNFPITIGALNGAGSLANYATNQCAFASIGDGLTDAEALAFYNAVQTFNTTLGRQV